MAPEASETARDVADIVGGSACGPGARGVHLCAWDDGRLAWVAVSGLSSPELEDLAPSR